MRRINGPQARALMRTMGLGDYGASDPNTGHLVIYSESEVFRALQGGPMSGPGYASDGSVVEDPYRNPISFTPYQFSTNNTSGTNGSQKVLAQNMRRRLLLVQNQSTSADLYVNFGADAGLFAGILLDPGLGVFFDIVCPNNDINVYFDSATNQPGIVIEGAPVI